MLVYDNYNLSIFWAKWGLKGYLKIPSNSGWFIFISNSVVGISSDEPLNGKMDADQTG